MFWALCALVSGVGTVASLLHRQWWDALLALISAQAWYWFALGGWLRTPWGQPHLAEYAPPVSNEPAMSARRSQFQIAAAAVCAAALVVAFAYQWVVAHA